MRVDASEIVTSPVTGDEINVTLLVAAVRDLAARSPDNLYLPAVNGGGCYYSRGECRDGSCGCIVGQALAAIGLDPVRYDVADGSVPSAARVVGGTTLGGSAEWLRRVQGRQDNGVMWGVAVRQTDEMMGLPVGERPQE